MKKKKKRKPSDRRCLREKMKSKGRILVKRVNSSQGSRAWGDGFWKTRHLDRKGNMAVMRVNEGWRKDSLKQEEIRFIALGFHQFFKLY